MKAVLSLLFVLLLAACGAPAAPGSVDASAGNPTLDLATTRATDQGAFQVSYTSDLAPLAINKLHSWVLHVETPDGQPVAGATVHVDGGMPAHNHGLPTAPQVTESGGGDYRVDGMKFQMPGHWTVTVHVDADGKQDVVTFNLMLP